MEEVCGGSTPHMRPGVLQSEHVRVKMETLKEFHTKKKMGGEEFSDSYRVKLEADLEEMFEPFKQINKLKGGPTYTPAVFLIIMSVFYVISSILGLLGQHALSYLFNILMYGCLLIVSSWIYFKTCGMEEFAEALDVISYTLWEGAIKPMYLAFINNTASRALGVPSVAQTPPSSTQKPWCDPLH